MKAHRIHVGEAAAAVYAGLHRMSERAESAALGAGITARQIELIKLRCSQINGCAYCLEQHVRVATEAGESPTRLAVRPLHHEAGALTGLSHNGSSPPCIHASRGYKAARRTRIGP